MSNQVYYDKKGVERKDVKEKAKLQSCTEANPLNEFLYQAEIANEEFQGHVHKEIKINQQQVIFKQRKIYSGVTDQEKRKEILQKVKFLRIPRRPAWQKLSKEQIEEQENEIFLKWRSELQKLEDNFPEAILTPYEKNLDVWRQLWRTIERSDVVIQIVDCRDPLFYRCEDIEEYAESLGKKVFLILNKADLLPQKVRVLLSEELKQIKVDHIFFSAKEEQKKIDDQPEDVKEEQVESQIPMNTEAIINKQELYKIFDQLLNSLGRPENT